MSDAIVVGAGLWGAVVARELAEAGRKVCILEERDRPGGNCRSEIDPETNVECHQYGAHIFHTEDETVWRYITRFTEFNHFTHRVLTIHKGQVYAMPLGLTLINAFYHLNLTPSQVPAFIAEQVKAAGLTHAPENLEEQAISFVGRPLYEAFIKGYTRKQWNADPRTLPRFIIQRLPVRTSYDIAYFNDPHQGMPLQGYGAIFKKLLDHPNITVRYNTSYQAEKAMLPQGIPLFYSGAIDRFFDYSLGELPWRALRFEWEHRDVDDFQGTPVMNYADEDVPYTRIHEFKHFHPERHMQYTPGKTIICREFSSDWRKGDEPFYPVNTPDATALFTRYQQEASTLPNVVLGGRLGEYRYYNMDTTIKRALEQVKPFL